MTDYFPFKLFKYFIHFFSSSIASDGNILFFSGFSLCRCRLSFDYKVSRYCSLCIYPPRSSVSILDLPINVFHKIWEHYSHSSFKLFFVHWFLLSFWNSHCKYFRILDYHISLWGSFFNIVSFLSFNIVSYYSLDWIIAFDSS